MYSIWLLISLLNGYLDNTFSLIYNVNNNIKQIFVFRGLSQNLAKFQARTFNRMRSSILFSYHICGSKFLR